MAEGEHTIISKIPRERLNQIAGRKLSALGVPVRLAADRETLEGDLAFAARVANPLGKRAALLHDLAARLRGLRLEAGFDADRLLVRAVVKTPGHAFEL